jgi:hypothetical protein
VSRSRPLTDTAAIPADDLEALFAFGQRSRRALRNLLATFPTERWDIPLEMPIGPHTMDHAAEARSLRNYSLAGQNHDADDAGVR